MVSAGAAENCASVEGPTNEQSRLFRRAIHRCTAEGKKRTARDDRAVRQSEKMMPFNPGA